MPSAEEDIPNEEESVLYEEVEEDAGQDEESAQESSQEAPQSLREMFFSLPDGLLKVALQQLLTAVVSALVAIGVLITMRAPQSAILFIASGWLIWLALSICYDYHSGEILERPLLCVSVQRGPKIQNRTRVVFRTQEEVPTYFEYFVPGRKVRAFTENYAYVIYVRKSNPRLMLGYQPL